MLKINTVGTKPYRLIVVDQFNITYGRYQKLDPRIVPIIKTLNRINTLYLKDRKKARELIKEYPSSYLKPTYLFKKRVSDNDVVAHHTYLLIGANTFNKDKVNKRMLEKTFVKVEKTIYSFGVTSMSIDMSELMLLAPVNTIMDMMIKLFSPLLIEIEIIIDDTISDKDIKYITRRVNKKK